ncbi:MAG: flagellar protein [Halobacteriovorax sp.]|nr:flagellar protein [Halobacteriovorax sp.]|tara:strand:- start:13137 stop:13538 length:402 start_codon:yes stop_codon:yes gene_type:complete
MTNDKIKNILIPQVNKVSTKKSENLKSPNSNKPDEFQNLLNKTLEPQKEQALEISKHAAKRLEERDLKMDTNEFFKLQDAVKKLKQKGGRDSLVITDKAAYIVDVNNNRVVTAIDKAEMAENVFTKIDSTLMI